MNPITKLWLHKPTIILTPQDDGRVLWRVIRANGSGILGSSASLDEAFKEAKIELEQQ